MVKQDITQKELADKSGVFSFLIIINILKMDMKDKIFHFIPYKYDIIGYIF